MTHMHRIASATVTLREAGHTSKNGNYLAHDRSCQMATKGLGRIMKPGTPGYGVGIFWQNFASQSVIMLTKNWQIFIDLKEMANEHSLSFCIPHVYHCALSVHPPLLQVSSEAIF